MVHLTKPVGPNDHTIGPQDADVTLVEYGSYDCPHCRQALAITLALLKEFHEGRPSLRLVYRHFAHTNGHSPAQRAAEVAEAAGEQGKFWEMHEHLLKNTQALDDGNLLAYSALLGLSVRQVAADLEQRTYRERVVQDVHDGVESGVRSTPTFFINGVRHDSDWDLATLRAAIFAAIQ
jgi:protein-disulfide isomerase